MPINRSAKQTTVTPFIAMQKKTALVSTNSHSEIKPALVAGSVVATKRTPAKKRRPRPTEADGTIANTAASRVQRKAQPKVHNKAVSPVVEPVAAKILLRPLTFQDDGFIQGVTQEEIAPIFKATYGYDLDMPMVMNYVHAANTRMIVIDDQVAGYISYVPDDSGKLNIGSLVLTPEYQGKKYGTRVMRQLEIEARQMGIAELEVFIQETNTRSQAFAESLGFTRVQSMQPQTIVMIKSLQQQPTFQAQGGQPIQPSNPTQG